MNAVRLPDPHDDPAPVTVRTPRLERCPAPANSTDPGALTHHALDSSREPREPLGALPAWGAPGGLLGALRAELATRAFDAVARVIAKVKGRI